MMNWKARQSNCYLYLATCFALMAMAWLAGGNIAAQVGRPPTLLYVVDTGEVWGDHSQILQFDTGQGKILKTFDASQDPDMALSPDGTRLYVTTYVPDPMEAPENWLSVYDTASGRLLERIRNQEAIMHTAPVYGSAMVFSASGRWLYMTKFHFNQDRSYYWYIAAFDTMLNQFLPTQVKFPCHNMTMVPARQDLNVLVVCRNSPFVFDTNLEDSATPMKRVPIRPAMITVRTANAAPSDTAASLVPSARAESWGAVFLLPREDKVGIIDDSEGSIFSFDHTAGTSQKVGQDLRLRSDGIRRGLVSENEDAVYFQFRSSRTSINDQSLSRSDQILSADPKAFAFKGALKTSKPFLSMTLSKDGNTLFTVNPDTATIGVIDTSTLTEVRQIPNVGRRPIFAIAAP